MRIPNTREWWETEVKWIESEGNKECPMAQFNQYCQMQISIAKKDAFPDIAERILKVIENRKVIK